MKLSATTIPLAGWLPDPREPERSRTRRLTAIQRLVGDYRLPAVELTLDLAAAFPQVFDRPFYAAVADLQQKLGFVCTAHLPLLWLDLASVNEAVRRASLDSLRRTIELTRPLELETYTLHLWGATTTQIYARLQHPAERQAALGGLMVQMMRSLAELCEIVDPRDLCVENLETLPFDQFVPLIEGGGASICLDVGHLAYQGENEIDFFRRHRERIREVHLHDAASLTVGGQRRTRDHLALGQGEIDYRAFLEELEASGYDGTVVLEVVSQADLEESLARLQDYLPT